MRRDPDQPTATHGTLRFPRGKRARVPTVMQMESTECGAAALAMVLAYHGLHVPLEQLRVDCGISRDGSKAGNMARAARKYGLQAQGRRVHDLEDAALLTVPYIAFWGFNHFLVVEGFGPTSVWVNDPASGPRRVTAEEFDESFTGIVIELTPGPDFRPGGERRGVLRAVARRLVGLHRELSLVILLGLALVVPGLLIPAFVRVFVDQILVDENLQWANPVLWGLSLTIVVQAFLASMQRLYLLRVQTSLMVGMAGRFVWHVLRLPLVYFSQRFGGEIGFRVALNDRLAQTLSGDIAASVVACLMMVFYFGIMLTYDVVLALLGLAFAVASIGVLRAVAQRRGDINRRMRADAGKWIGTSIAGIQTIETLKAGGTESEFFARWAGAFARVTNAEAELASKTRTLQALPALLNALNSAAILALGAHRVMSGHLSVGSLVAFQSLVAGFLLPVNTLVGLGAQLQEVEGDVERLEDVLRHPLDPTWERPPRPEPGPRDGKTRLDGDVELRNVTFGYSPLEPPLISGFSLRLPAGNRVALVGPSGSGKTTVARLLGGLYRPWSGEVLFDGIPREDVPRRLLCASFALVDQETFIFAGTARENITLWDETIAEAEMVQAARDACIHDDVSARAGGYDQMIEEGGRNLSGGQQQRLEIARALALSPRILVLDEATSALDPGVELRLDRNIRRRGCSCIIIAHRLSTIRDADEIVVMDRGKIVERGTHEDLAALGGLYTKLIET
jgi:NHLM bacteriocin system ABC transporter peptidase/ATP-binding protein